MCVFYSRQLVPNTQWDQFVLVTSHFFWQIIGKPMSQFMILAKITTKWIVKLKFCNFANLPLLKETIYSNPTFL